MSAHFKTRCVFVWDILPNKDFFGLVKRIKDLSKNKIKKKKKGLKDQKQKSKFKKKNA